MPRLPFTRMRAAYLALALAAGTHDARAQPSPAHGPPAAATPAPKAPVVQGSTDVPYPQDGHGDAVVLLDLVIDKEGAVASAEVTEGVAPFAEQARRAVLAWKFLPARRGDVPVAARIRARVAFHQEVRVGAPDGASTPSSADAGRAQASSSASVEPLEEVTVRARRHDIGQTTIAATDVREMPGAFGDPFRAIEALPGVAPVLSGLPYFYIRGAPPNDNGFFVDGVRVPLLFHVGVGQGVIHPSLLDRVDFFAGAPPAAYGGFAGGIVAGQLREPATRLHGEANLRIVDAGTLVESPFAEGRGSALVSGRFGYPGPVLGAFAPDVRLGYWDYQSRVTWKLSDRDTLGVLAFGSHDYLATGAPLVEQLSSDFHRVDLRYDHVLTDARGEAVGRVRVGATVGYDSQGAAPSYVTSTSTAVRVQADRKLSTIVRLRGGVDARFEHYGFANGAPLTSPDGTPLPPIPSTADPPPTNVSGGAHADVVWNVTPRVEIVPGARVDVFESTRATGAGGTRTTTVVPAFDPRLATRVAITRSAAWISTVGISHQYPALRVGSLPSALVSVPGFPGGSSELQTATKASQGVELALPADFAITTTAFLSGFSGLTDLTASCIQVMPALAPRTGVPAPYTCPGNDPVHGRAYGLELLVRRPLTKRLSGWLSYTLSRSVREAHFITASGGDAVATVPSDYDRTHVLNAILAYEPGLGWRGGARMLVYSGAPFSSLNGNVPVPPYNSRRGPGFFRLDVRFEKRWTFSNERALALVFEVENATLSKEVTPFGLECSGEPTAAGQTTSCSPATAGPITIPSIGLEVFF